MTVVASALWPRVVGHHAQIEMLRRAATRGRLAHAYLFSGTKGIGKRQVAQQFAWSMLCDQSDLMDLRPCGHCKSCQLLHAGNHPDFIEIEKPEGKSELPIELFVGSRDERGKAGLLNLLSLKPMRSQKRVAIIDDADLMNDASGNALLKTLEEPPAHAMLILLTSQPERVISTIRSRCQTVYLGELTAEQIQTILSQEIPDKDQQPIPANVLAQLQMSGGSLEDIENLRQPVWSEISQFLKLNLFHWPLDAILLNTRLQQLIQDIGGDASTQRDNLRILLKMMTDLCRGLLWELTGIGEKTPDGKAIFRQSGDLHVTWEIWEKQGVELLVQWMERMLDAELDLLSAMSVPLCFESLCYDLANLQRHA
jgi:DNA polymerase-3 subunit delta'